MFHDDHEELEVIIISHLKPPQPHIILLEGSSQGMGIAQVLWWVSELAAAETTACNLSNHVV